MDTTPNRFSQWLIIAVLSMTAFNSPQAQSQEEWDVTVPRGNTREISFTTKEGTWTSTDISGDGSWVVFDLLGHIYRLPVTGGQAVSLTQNSGMAMNYHPRISPAGKPRPLTSAEPTAFQLTPGCVRGRMEFCPGSMKMLCGQTCVLTTSGMERPGHRAARWCTRRGGLWQG